MSNRNYKKYMKQESTTRDYNLVKLFIISFCGMLLFFIFIIKSFPTVDVSIGDNTAKDNMEMEENANIDGRLSALQEEDTTRSFSDMTSHPTDVEQPQVPATKEDTTQETVHDTNAQTVTANVQPIYKVYIGSYTSSEQAKVARDIIQDTGSGMTPIVKCIGSNNYTLQVGTFKNKSSAEALLYSVQQNHLPGRIVQEY